MNPSAKPYIPPSGVSMPTVPSLLAEIKNKDLAIHNLCVQVATLQVHMDGLAKTRDERIASLDEENEELNTELTSVREAYNTKLAELTALRDQHSKKEASLRSLLQENNSLRAQNSRHVAERAKMDNTISKMRLEHTGKEATLRSLLEEKNSLKAEIEAQNSRHLAEKDEMEKTIAELRTALSESQKIVVPPVQQTTLPDIPSIISEHTSWLDKLSYDLQSELSSNADKIHPGFRLDFEYKFVRRLVMINVGLINKFAPENLSPSALSLISSSSHLSSAPSLGAVFRERMLSQ